jgi:hypothetical protein
VRGGEKEERGKEEKGRERGREGERERERERECANTFGILVRWIIVIIVVGVIIIVVAVIVVAGCKPRAFVVRRFCEKSNYNLYM